jgi:hypothetical protein
MISVISQDCDGDCFGVYCGSTKRCFLMQGEIREHWQKLCEQAAVEKDPEALLELTTEINRLLREKEVRLKHELEPTS